MKHAELGANYPLIIATISWGIIVFIVWVKGMNYILKNKDKNSETF